MSLVVVSGYLISQLQLKNQASDYLHSQSSKHELHQLTYIEHAIGCEMPFNNVKERVYHVTLKITKMRK